jgi:hypothetical protein
MFAQRTCSVCCTRDRYVNRLRKGVTWETLGGRWDGWDTVFAALLLTAPLGAAFAGLRHHEWTACQDTLRMTSIAWFLKRSGYGDSEWLRLHITLQASTVVAVLWALRRCVSAHLRGHPAPTPSATSTRASSTS